MTPTDIQVRGGIFIPFDTNLRDVSDNFGGLGVDVLFPQEYLPNSKTYLSVDWLAKSFSGSHGNIIPVCINQKFYGKPVDGHNVYLFVGLGATFFDVYGSDTRLGARAGVGYDLSQNVFLEGTFYWSDKSNNGDVSNIGAGFYIGYRW
jgi:hypothetical protein